MINIPDTCQIWGIDGAAMEKNLLWVTIDFYLHFSQWFSLPFHERLDDAQVVLCCAQSFIYIQ